jgi:(1->4)-alpha-D-glucan 1-alpha-D-glucosylmutase
MLAELKDGMAAEEIMKRMDSGLPKLWLVHQALHLRGEQPECFDRNAAYSPLAVDGAKQDHMIAYLRGEAVAVVAPRWNVRLGGNAASTTVELPDGRWTHLLTSEFFDGGKVRVQNLLRNFPVALLKRITE